MRALYFFLSACLLQFLEGRKEGSAREIELKCASGPHARPDNMQRKEMTTRGELYAGERSYRCSLFWETHAPASLHLLARIQS